MQAIREVDVGGIVRGNPRRENCGENEDEDEHDSDGRKRIVAGDAGERDGEGRHFLIIGDDDWLHLYRKRNRGAILRAGAVY